ncbi:hypothetical protein RvY_15340 [Ramazzottius varieornatus]|uniref:Uncharacterized protein n=1 Tax=Ramazzottius varieornatus TaxID=947166 RepID=A0A1D1VZA7_RAMVA|nr:hypothetical protein RvY_15340 [Ramazzottius varieornatus]
MKSPQRNLKERLQLMASSSCKAALQMVERALLFRSSLQQIGICPLPEIYCSWRFAVGIEGTSSSNPLELVTPEGFRETRDDDPVSKFGVLVEVFISRRRMAGSDTVVQVLRGRRIVLERLLLLFVGFSLVQGGPTFDSYARWHARRN